MNENEDLLAIKIANTINDILAWRGIYDCGKNFTEDVKEHILPLLRENCRHINTFTGCGDCGKIIQTLKI